MSPAPIRSATSASCTTCIASEPVVGRVPPALGAPRVGAAVGDEGAAGAGAGGSDSTLNGLELLVPQAWVMVRV